MKKDCNFIDGLKKRVQTGVIFFNELEFLRGIAALSITLLLVISIL